MTVKEETFAKQLTEAGRRWELCDSFPLSKSSYQPDFYLPDEDLYIELVGSASTYSHNKRKYEEFIELYPEKKFIIVGVDGEPYVTLERQVTGRTIKKENKITCTRCGYEWVAKRDRPRKCPMCSSYKYDQPREEQK